MSLKYLRTLSNENLIESLECACMQLAHKETKLLCKHIKNLEKVILERMEVKENV